MKKLFISLLVLCSLPAFADAKNLTLGETLSLYFTEIFPSTGQEITSINLKYNDIGANPTLRSALQRGIYYGMMPNSDGNLKPSTSRTDRAFVQLLRARFGVDTVGDLSNLTQVDYEAYMSDIRKSYAYRLMQSINQNTMKDVIQQPSAAPGFNETENYYILDEVYAALYQGYLHSEDIDDADLVYAATE